MAHIECRNPDYWGARCISLYASDQEFLTPSEADELATGLLNAAKHIRDKMKESEGKPRNALGIVIDD